MTNNGSPANVSGMIEVAAGKERYFRWYEAICVRGQVRALDSGFERHHIVPRSLGGTDDASNLTRLTYREHFLAHWLLTKFTEGGALRKMQYALHMMTASPSRCGRAVTGWQFEVVRSVVSLPKAREHAARIGAALKGRPKSAEHREKLRASLTGKAPSDEARARMSAAQVGREHSVETKAKIKAANLGKVRSAATRARVSAAKKGVSHGPRSAETRAKIAASNSKPFSDERKAALRAGWARRRRRLAEANNELASHAVA